MKCHECGTEFDPKLRVQSRAKPQYVRVKQSKYCCEKCARKAENRRYYEAHKAHK